MHNKAFKYLYAFTVILFIISIASYLARSLFPVRYEDEINASCREFGVDKHLVLALIKAESNFNPDAESHADAKGVMQLTEDTFDFCNLSLGVNDADILNPAENIRAGVWFLSYLSEKYDGNMKNILAAYNAGMGNVDRWLEDSRYSSDGKSLKKIPFSETAHYVEKIKRYKIIYRFL